LENLGVTKSVKTPVLGRFEIFENRPKIGQKLEGFGLSSADFWNFDLKKISHFYFRRSLDFDTQNGIPSS